MSDRIGFSTGAGLLSRIIRWFSRSSVSHAWLLYYDVDFNRDMVLESTLEGVRIIPFEVFQKHNKIIKVFTPDFSLKVGLAKAGEILGEQYDFTGLLGMVWVMLGRWLRKKWHNPLDSTKGLFCSEFVANVLRWSGAPSTEFWDPSTMTPENLLEYLLARQTV